MAGNTVRIRAVLDDKVSGGLAKIHDRFDRLGKSKGAMSILQGVGLGAGSAAFTALGAAAGKATDFIADSIQAASNMNESVSKSSVVFAESAGEIREWASTAADSMGTSEQAALEASATLGNLLLSMGKTSAEAADMSKTMVQLAADLGSFNNVPIEEVLMAMRSGLTGEIAPLRRFGVNLTEAALKAKALALGLSDGVGVLDASAKSAAAYALILEQTTTAQGDFARTSKGMANQQKILAARLADTEAELGEKMIPTVIGVQQAFIALFDTLGGHSGQTSGIAAAIEANMVEPTEAGLRKTKAALEQGIRDLGPLILFAGESLGIGKAEKNALEQQLILVEAALKRVEAGGLAWAANWGSSASSVVQDTVKVGGAFEDMAEDMVSAAGEAIDNAYDPILTHNKLLATQVEIAAAQRVIASSTATAAEKRDARDALAELGKDQAEYVLKLAEAGQTGSGAYKNAIASLKASIAAATGPTKKYLQEAYDWIIKVENAGKVIPINFVASWGNMGQAHPDHRASGGPAGGLTWVGEEGPELVSLPSGSHVYSNPQSMAMTGGGVSEVHTHIYLDGRQIAESVDRHNAENLQRAPVWGGRY